MKRKRFTEEQIAFALRQAEAGAPVADVIRKLGASEQTFYRWKRKYAGMGVAVALDMWEPYIQCVKRWCKNADVVCDLFHVVKAFNEVIDDIRNEEFRKSDSANRATLKGSKYLFLKNWENLLCEQRIRLDAILAMNARLNTVYWLKDLLAHIWSYRRVGWAAATLDPWCAVAFQEGHPALVRFARTLQKHAHGILNHCRHSMHTSRVEGVNNKITVIKRIAYGFHDLDYFALKVKQAFPGRLCSN